MIDTKYLTMCFDDSYSREYPIPKIGIGWFKNKGNLKRSYYCNDSFYVKIDFFGKEISLDFKFNYKERQKNEQEIELSKRIQEVFDRNKLQ